MSEAPAPTKAPAPVDVIETPALESLFLAGQDGFHTCRIPALATTPTGAVLAFCEGRRFSAADDGDIDLLLRCGDGTGRGWGPTRRIADDGRHTMGNPCPVVDTGRGTIWLPFCRDNRSVLLMHSGDEGRTWSAPRDITAQAVDPAWHWVGTGPGHGIQLSSGRLIVPCWADATPRMGEEQFSFVIYSDDGGGTWKRSVPLDRNASDQCEVVELSDGSLYLSARHRGGGGRRGFAHSRDGGETWTSVQYDSRLVEPDCQGSLIACPVPGSSRPAIVLCTPGHPHRRERLTLRISGDDGRTWPVWRVLYPGLAAYSDLAVTAGGELLCLFEADGSARLALARLALARGILGPAPSAGAPDA